MNTCIYFFLTFFQFFFFFFFLLLCSLAGCGRRSVAFEPFSLVALQIPPAMVWLEPFVLPVRGMPVRVGLWISQRAPLSDLIDQICQLVDDLAAGEHGGPLDPESIFLASTDIDGMHIRRRLVRSSRVEDIYVQFPLRAFEVPHVCGVQHVNDDEANEPNEPNEPNEVSKNNTTPLKMVHRVWNDSLAEYQLISTPSLICVEADARIEDVAKAACVLCTKSCGELLLDTVRRDGSDSDESQEEEEEYNEMGDGGGSGMDGSYEMVGSELEEDSQMTTLVQKPWLVLLNSGLCELRIVHGSKRADLRSQEGEEMLRLGDDQSIASELSVHSTICFDWSTHVAGSILNLSDAENCITHPSFTMERDHGSSHMTDPPLAAQSTSAQGKETIVTLSQCLDQFTAAEFLSMQCEQCEQCDGSILSKHSKKLSFTRLPPVFVLSFKRFKNMGRMNSKIETKVSFPVRGLDMGNWLEGNNSTEENSLYDLVAVVNHSGKLGYGHYTAYGLTEQGSWALYDDEDVTIVGKSEAEDHEGRSAESLKVADTLITRQAYLLVYVKRESGENV